MLSWPGRLAVTLFAACLLAGCQPAAPPPTPVPTYACTPEAGGAEFSCSQQQYDEMVAKDKLYAEAEAVYRSFLAEDARVLRNGGAIEPTSELTRVAAEAFLKDVMKNYQTLAQRGVKAVGGDPRLVYFRRSPGVSKTGSVVAATICVDGSSLDFIKDGDSLGRGRIAKDETYFGRVDGVLKIIGADGKQVSSCE